MRNVTFVAGLLVSTAACSTSSSGPATTTDPSSSTAMPGSTTTTPQVTGTSSVPSTTSGATGNSGATGMSPPTTTANGGSSNETTGSSSTTSNAGSSSVGPTGASSTNPSTPIDSETATSDANQGSSQGNNPDGSSADVDSSSPVVMPVNNCVGDKLPSANPKSAGPFQVAADKNVGPLAGVVPDPIYGDEQQRYNVYRPANLATSGHCHPILIWANGYRDNPEQNPPDCIVDSNANRWCGQYLPMLNHLASHGFVVVASLSTATAEGDPLPTIAGLDWILEQAEDPASPYYHRLDTSNIGQLGHSYGGMSTCMSASEPRYKALATICGTRALSGVHTPMLFFCGGQDTTVNCSGVRDTFLSVTDQPAFFLNERDADHGSWVYEGPGGVSLSAAAAWFRAHLMDDTESRKFFYGQGCTFCTDNRVEAEQNSLMQQ